MFCYIYMYICMYTYIFCYIYMYICVCVYVGVYSPLHAIFVRRDPLVHKGWMKGDAYVKTARLRMENPLVSDREFYDSANKQREI